MCEQSQAHKNIENYLSDPQRLVALINQVYPKDDQFAPVDPTWIDVTNTRYMTEVMRHIVPAGYPFDLFVMVEKDPDWKLIAKEECEMGHDLRYILLSVIMDAAPIYLENYGIFHTSAVAGLAAWEMARCTAGACTALARAQFVEELEVPALQRARIEHIAINLGREPASKNRIRELNSVAIMAKEAIAKLETQIDAIT